MTLKEYVSHVKGYLMILKNWTTDIPMNEIDFLTTEFWVEIHGLPPTRMIRENAQLLRS